MALKASLSLKPNCRPRANRRVNLKVALNLKLSRCQRVKRRVSQKVVSHNMQQHIEWNKIILRWDFPN